MRRALRPVITDTFGDKTHGEGYNAEHSFQKISRRNLKVQFLRRSSGAVLFELAAFDKLVKPACGTVSGLVLVKKGKAILVENLEEFIPADFLEILLFLAKVDTQYTTFSFGADH